MSLTDWVEWDKDVFKWFNKPKLNISGDLLAPPLTTHYSTVGTAFDYALRFLISKTYRIYDNNDKWVAHHSIGNNKQRKDFIKTVEHKFNEYLYSNQLSISDFYSDFIIMARLDAIFRSGQERPNIEIFNVPPDTIKELQTLINITDINLFKFEHQCLLNPTFGKSSQDIGGADADLVIDDTLIDIKTTKKAVFMMH
jgi:hypothetical protein